jgi:hypothetical protein
MMLQHMYLLSCTLACLELPHSLCSYCGLGNAQAHLERGLGMGHVSSTPHHNLGNAPINTMYNEIQPNLSCDKTNLLHFGVFLQTHLSQWSWSLMLKVEKQIGNVDPLERGCTDHLLEMPGHLVANSVAQYAVYQACTSGTHEHLVVDIPCKKLTSFGKCSFLHEANRLT